MALHISPASTKNRDTPPNAATSDSDQQQSKLLKKVYVDACGFIKPQIGDWNGRSWLVEGIFSAMGGI